MAASRKSEVTKLLTVTLDKIHESKRTKTGPNLRKSLLVASVLHKARDVYVAEIKNVRPVHSAAPMDSQSNNSTTSTSTCNDSTTNSSANVKTCTNNTTQESSVTTVRQSVALKRKLTSQQSVIEVEGDQESECNSRTDTDYHNDSKCIDSNQEDLTTDNSSSNEDFSSIKIKKRSFFGAKDDTRLDCGVANDFLEELATESETDCLTECETDSDHFNIVTDKENSPPCKHSNSNFSESTVAVVTSDSIHCSTPESHVRCLKRGSSIKYDGDTNSSELDLCSLPNSNVTTYSYIPRKRFRMTSVDYSESESDVSSVTVSRTVDPSTATQINHLVRIFSHSFDVGGDVHTYEKPTELNTFGKLCRDSIALTA